jgi:hypothetical protein
MYVHKGAAEFLFRKMTVATYLGGGDAPANTVSNFCGLCRRTIVQHVQYPKIDFWRAEFFFR